MARKAAAALCLEHLVAEHIVLRNKPIGLNVVWIDVLIRQRTDFPTALAATLGAEAVHLALIVIFDEALPAMAEITLLHERHFLKLHVNVAARSFHLALCRAVCSRKSRKQIIEAAVLLNHHDDMRDVTRSPGTVLKRRNAVRQNAEGGAAAGRAA